MSINQKLKDRNQGQCELCNAEEATIEYTVSPKMMMLLKPGCALQYLFYIHR
ncbi:MAG: hypothetical protein IPL10_05610 [Bacteroidetes bacterium]|nr:hypothetical protein [Bacteroidota bacterium]